MHEFTEIARHTIYEFLDIVDNMSKVSKRKMFWQHLIKTHNLTCPVSKEEVDHCRYDYCETAKSYHYNFYTKDGKLFTIDHCVPKSKGGKDHTSNIQPMLADINFAKGSNMMHTL